MLTVYVYDFVLGFLGKRLLGVANIPLEPYVKRLVTKMYYSTLAIESVPGFGSQEEEKKGGMLSKINKFRRKNSRPKTAEARKELDKVSEVVKHEDVKVEIKDESGEEEESHLSEGEDLLEKTGEVRDMDEHGQVLEEEKGKQIPKMSGEPFTKIGAGGPQLQKKGALVEERKMLKGLDESQTSSMQDKMYSKIRGQAEKLDKTKNNLELQNKEDQAKKKREEKEEKERKRLVKELQGKFKEEMAKKQNDYENEKNRKKEENLKKVEEEKKQVRKV